LRRADLGVEAIAAASARAVIVASVQEAHGLGSYLKKERINDTYHVNLINLDI
jgi:hypothetical protein